ncbi:MAG: glycosyltransferase [Thermoplasmata archaeon]|nr:glycosyltransferase [Thermoplasmata archaeon]
MRIAMFTDSWLPTMDGCVASVLKFRDGLEKRGHKVFIFAPEDKNGLAKEDDRTFLFKAREFKQYPEYRMAIMLSARKDNLLKEHDIEMIHTHGVAFMGFKAMMSSRNLKLPLLLHFHTWVTEVAQYYPFNLNEEFLVDLFWLYLKPLCRKSDGVVAPSNNAIEELKKIVTGMEYTDWVFPGIEVDKFNPEIKGNFIRERHGLENNEVILHVGRLSLEKNLELVLDGMKILKTERPNAKLLVVGNGPARPHYDKLVKEKGLEDRVIFSGFVPSEELPNYYAACDSFVLASKFETLGIVMTEALASGKPVAGVNFRVIPDVIKHGENGYIFQPDSKDCAKMMIATLDAPDEMRQNAVKRVSMFDSDTCMAKLEIIYEISEEIHASRREKTGTKYTRVLKN